MLLREQDKLTTKYLSTCETDPRIVHKHETSGNPATSGIACDHNLGERESQELFRGCSVRHID